ncbi:tail fiber domain-containing protein [Vibrio pectenicida]|uniref:Tail fiber domain-containing protein n=1 Tax=Vibrio pectenicida TaxID=62763 RepID=A0A7Y4EDZ2_9VIBR|nr:tail fiber domain-containing protein [Vibrio pectenicida]NOH70818.1 tail fiber domain-containing protein [Vibrio pectenicida]
MISKKLFFFITIYMGFTPYYSIAEQLNQPKICSDKFQPWCSDKELKRNISNIASTIDKIVEIQGVRYQLNGSNQVEFGFIAQDLQRIYPEVVRESYDMDYLRVDYRSMIAILLEAVKEQEKRIRTLESLIEKDTTISE